MAVPQGCGIGGYGGHMVISLKGGKKITAIDFNTAAPAAARADMFPIEPGGAVRGRINSVGWLAAGVPGTLAGLQLALSRYGTRDFREMVARLFTWQTRVFQSATAWAEAFRAPRISCEKIPPQRSYSSRMETRFRQGDKLRNPDLAKMLESLARQNSVEPFYQGEIARQIASEFQTHGGLVTAKDLAAYQAREVEPLESEWRGITLRTAPLTAGGLTVLQALSILKALGWDKLPASPSRTHALVEALRLSWQDRLQLLGDPAQVEVPIQRLLSDEHAHRAAARSKRQSNNAKPFQSSLRPGRKAGRFT